MHFFLINPKKVENAIWKQINNFAGCLKKKKESLILHLYCSKYALKNEPAM